jgi:hypothetical protein
VVSVRVVVVDVVVEVSAANAAPASKREPARPAATVFITMWFLPDEQMVTGELRGQARVPKGTIDFRCAPHGATSWRADQSCSKRVTTIVAVLEIGDRLELIVAGVAVPEIRGASVALLDPFRNRDRHAALSTRVVSRKSPEVIEGLVAGL